MKLFFFYDRNFAPLRDHFVASLQQSDTTGYIEIHEDTLEDLQTMRYRAGGGLPTYIYKAAKIREAFSSVDDGEVFLFSDVDVQFFLPLREVVEEVMVPGVDLVLQREFEDIGTNIGFMALRNTPAHVAFWDSVLAEIKEKQGLDQRVVNNLLYSGRAAQEFGIGWDRFPCRVWCSSMAFSGPTPEGVVLHHANFLVERAVAADPAPKLAQLRCLRKALLPEGPESGSTAPAEWAEFIDAVRSCQAMHDYRDRHFGARRPGPEWSVLPEGHVARPGGFREKRGASAAAPESAATVEGDPRQ